MYPLAVVDMTHVAASDNSFGPEKLSARDRSFDAVDAASRSIPPLMHSLTLTSSILNLPAWV